MCSRIQLEMEFKLKRHSFSKKEQRSKIYEHVTMEFINTILNYIEREQGWSLVGKMILERGFNVSTLEKYYWCRIDYRIGNEE